MTRLLPATHSINHGRLRKFKRPTGAPLCLPSGSSHWLAAPRSSRGQVLTPWPRPLSIWLLCWGAWLANGCLLIAGAHADPAVVPAAEGPAAATADLSALDPEAAALIRFPPTSASPPSAPTPGWYHPRSWFGPAPWDIGFELGLNGNEGINETLSMRVGGHVKRETDRWKLDTTIAYNKNTANNVETQNNALLDARVDRIFADSPWSLFFLNQDLYDEFQAFDLRVSLTGGVGYQIIDTKTVSLAGSFGAGASHEFGAVDAKSAYEALFGLDYEHEFSSMQRFSAKVDYFPEWENFGFYRIVTDIGWEIDLDRPKNLSLKFSVIDRYDSTPNGVKPNELNYAALLIWGL